jgi:hypothetical protein
MRRQDLVLHLHRLEDDEALALAHAIARLYPHGGDGAGHGRQRRVLAGAIYRTSPGKRRIRERRGDAADAEIKDPVGPGKLPRLREAVGNEAHAIAVHGAYLNLVRFVLPGRPASLLG